MSNEFKPSTTPIEKAVGPMGSKIVPDSYNGMASANTIGGFEDAAPSPGMTMAGTARRGQGPAAYATTEAPDMSPPSPYPGKSGKAAPNALAPSKLVTAPMAHSTPTMAAETGGKAMTNLARGGGKVGIDPAAHRAPTLPAPMPTFEGADNPGGSFLQGPPTAGRMAGEMQGRAGRTPGAADLSS